MTQAGYTPPQKSMPPKAEIAEETEKEQKTQKGNRHGGRRFAGHLFDCGAYRVLYAVFVWQQTAPYADKFLPNTSISGYALGGLTAQEGAAALAMLTDDAVSAWQYTLTWGERTYTLDGAAVSLAVDTAATLDRFGRLGAAAICSRATWPCCRCAATGRRKKPVLTL